MIKTIGVTKRFDDIAAVDHIDADIRDGSVFGLIGTNGAGKSTFLRMLAGILRPDEGEILIDNENVYENTARKKDFFYKLRDKDVELMAKCNAGEITREECEAQLSRRYHIG